MLPSSIPQFKADDIDQPDAWLSRVELYALANGFNEVETVQKTILHMDGPIFEWGLHYLQVKQTGHENITWPNFKKDFLHQFGIAEDEYTLRESLDQLFYEPNTDIMDF
ncbi:hypothetical protein BGZ58_006420, partial [Dissophora ornata]